MAFKVLFVCTGNTCRSPMAAAALKQAAQAENLPLEIKSAGTAAAAGMPLSEEAHAILSEKGLPTRHFSRLLQEEDVKWADMIIVMTKSHSDEIKRRFPFGEGKVYLLGSFLSPAGEIKDPIGGGREAYLQTWQSITSALPGLMETIRKILTQRRLK